MKARKTAALTAGVALAVTGSTMAGPVLAQAQGVDNTCVLALVKTDPATVNVAYPDQAAIYWAGAYQTLPGMRIRIQGQYPHARYSSFHVYDQAQRPLDAIADAELEPDPGNENPFEVGAKRTGDARAYTAFIEFGPQPEDPADRPPNTIYTGTGQNGTPNLNGTFIYRIYVPDSGRDETGGVGLPTVELQTADGAPPPESVCADFQGPTVPGINEQIANSDADIPVPGFARETPHWRKFTNLVDMRAADLGLNNDTTRSMGGSGGFFSNVHNAYVTSSISRDFGQVSVTRLRAPSFSDTRSGAKRMPGGQLRYFSMCQNERATQRFIACATDDQSAVGTDGFITYVVSTPEHRPATATAECGATWIPWGPAREGVLIYRHMLADPDFRQAIQFAEADQEADTMDDYFPTSSYYDDADAYDHEVGCQPTERK